MHFRNSIQLNFPFFAYFLRKNCNETKHRKKDSVRALATTWQRKIHQTKKKKNELQFEWSSKIPVPRRVNNDWSNNIIFFAPARIKIGE